MATEKIYWEDPYTREFTAKVTGTDGNSVSLDRTAFYPTGGGQPNDTGTISSNGTVYQVADVRKEGDVIRHTIGGGRAPPVGSEVSCRIDWPRRYAHMRYHTALHILDGVVQKQYKGRITGGQIYADRARMDFDVPGMDREMVLRIIADAQKVIDEDHRVSARFLTKEEADAIPDIARTEPGAGMMASMERVRVIDIEGFDVQMDGGTHVATTREIGRMSLKEYKNNGAHNKRVYIVLDD